MKLFMRIKTNQLNSKSLGFKHNAPCVAIAKAKTLKRAHVKGTYLGICFKGILLNKRPQRESC